MNGNVAYAVEMEPIADASAAADYQFIWCKVHNIAGSPGGLEKVEDDIGSCLKLFVNRDVEFRYWFWLIHSSPVLVKTPWCESMKRHRQQLANSDCHVCIFLTIVLVLAWVRLHQVCLVFYPGALKVYTYNLYNGIPLLPLLVTKKTKIENEIHCFINFRKHMTSVVTTLIRYCLQICTGSCTATHIYFSFIVLSIWKEEHNCVDVFVCFSVEFSKNPNRKSPKWCNFVNT